MDWNVGGHLYTDDMIQFAGASLSFMILLCDGYGAVQALPACAR
jgi:hypothetical protein